MTTKIDDRLAKVLTFEVGKTYGGYTVESRTACFVTFEGQKRRKIEICNGVETAPVYTYPNGIEKIIDIDAVEDFASENIPDIEIYKPVTTNDNTTVITDGDTDWRLASVNELTNNAVLVPTNEAKDPDGRTVRLVALPVLQAIIAKPSVASAEVKQEIRDRFLDLTECGVDHEQNPEDNFWQRIQAQIVPNFSAATVADYKAATDTKTFNVGQTYDDPSGLQFKVTSRTGDTVELATKFSKFIRQVMVDDNGEFVQLGTDRDSKLCAADTPSWFYDHGVTKDWLDRDCDRAANFEFFGVR